MDPRICIITGANSGIGKAAAVQIAQQGYRVIMACRNQERGETALTEVRERSGSDEVELMLVDLSLQSSIKAFAQRFLDKYSRLDVLIQNAAIFDITQKEANYTSEGIETIWATNHLGPVLLTDQLLGALKTGQSSRVITIASKGLIAKPFLKVDLEDPEYKNRRFSVENAYYQSKLAQVMFTFWLAEKGAEHGIKANCIRVPAVQSDIDKYPNLPEFLKKIYSIKAKFSITPDEMALAYTRLATMEKLKNVSGKYFDEKLNLVSPGKYAQQSENIDALMNLSLEYLKG